MNIEISTFTGFEDSCWLTFNSAKKNHSKTIYLENIEIIKSVRNNGKGKVQLISCNAKITELDNIRLELSEFEIKQIQDKMVECIDWDEFVHQQNESIQIDDFMDEY